MNPNSQSRFRAALSNADSPNSAFLAEELEELLRYPLDCEFLDMLLMSHNLSAFSGAHDLFLSLLHTRSGNYQKTFYWLEQHLARIGGSRPYFVACLTFLKLRSEHRSLEEALRILENVFGPSTTKDVENDLGQPENVFQHYRMPACPDCQNCSYVHDCQLPAWAEVMPRIRREAASRPVDQLALAQVFQSLPLETGCAL